MNDEHRPRPGLQLKALLKEAGITSSRLDATRRLAMFPGRNRDWAITLGMTADWFTLTTYVCAIPDAANIRADLFAAVMSLNQRMCMLKFSAAVGLHLEVEYRTEHVDAQVVRDLICFLHSTAEEHYPRLFRITSGDALLETLATNSALSTAA